MIAFTLHVAVNSLLTSPAPEVRTRQLTDRAAGGAIQNRKGAHFSCSVVHGRALLMFHTPEDKLGQKERESLGENGLNLLSFNNTSANYDSVEGLVGYKFGLSLAVLAYS